MADLRLRNTHISINHLVKLWCFHVCSPQHRDHAYLFYYFIYLADLAITFLFALLGIKIGHLKPEEELKQAPDEAAFYGIGGQRVDGTEHEAAVTG